MLLCDVAKNNGIRELYDTFEVDRDNTLDLFLSVGFNIIEYKQWKKFDIDVDGVVVRKLL